jgi:hypothetical protein
MQSGECRRSGAMSEAALSTPTWMALHPVSIVASGNTEAPVERLLALQSAISRVVHWATTLGQLRLWPLRGMPRLRLR